MLEWSKLKTFAEIIMDFPIDRGENILGKGGNTGFQHFLHYPCSGFQSLFPLRTKKLCGKEFKEQNFRLVQIESICRRQN